MNNAVVSNDISHGNFGIVDKNAIGIDFYGNRFTIDGFDKLAIGKT
ncbi:MAG: hypothetical protein IPP37_12105 [Saprospiraceae bacterium]|nr:hypothetical protein [Saprospiraceae bacterium]